MVAGSAARATPGATRPAVQGARPAAGGASAARGVPRGRGQAGTPPRCRHLLTSQPLTYTPSLPSGLPRPPPGSPLPAAPTHADGDAEHAALVVPVQLGRFPVAFDAAVGAQRRHGTPEHAPACQRFKPPRFRVGEGAEPRRGAFREL